MEARSTGLCTRRERSPKSSLGTPLSSKPRIADSALFNSPAKPSKPSRAYLQLSKIEYSTLLTEHLRNVTFNDAKGSSKDPSLLGKPSVQFAPYGRVPIRRARKDLRQGTIDQDQEFIGFLESLTNPITKSAPVDQGSDPSGKTKEKFIVTPLIQFLKDKKANKGKEVAPASKSVKHSRQDSKDNKMGVAHDKKPTKVDSFTTHSPDKRSTQATKVEKAARDVVRVISRQTSNSSQNPTSSSTSTLAAVAPSVSASAPLAEKRRERGSASAAAKILQRDLGLGANHNGRGGRRAALSAGVKPVAVTSNSSVSKQESSSTKPPKEPESTPRHEIAKVDSATTPTSSSTTPSLTKPSNNQPPRGPASSRASTKRTSSSDSKPTQKTSISAPAKHPSASPNATQAFLKHANPSQGITEPLLEEAFAGFGVVKKVEIDKKKGFAYVDFAEPLGLQKAIKASPIKVAQGQVVVLERRTGSTVQARNVRGGGAVGNRGGPPMGPRGGRGGSGRRGGGNVRGANGSSPSISNNPQATDLPASQKTTSSTTPALEGAALGNAESVVGSAILPTSAPAVAVNDGPLDSPVS